jgi:hypothetical protein
VEGKRNINKHREQRGKQRRKYETYKLVENIGHVCHLFSTISDVFRKVA